MLLALALLYALTAASTPVAAASPEASSSAAPAPGASGGANASDAVSIVNSGSTNVAGYELRVLPDGDLLPRPAAGVAKRVSPALVTRLFADLRAAGPLDRLSATHCMKSVSFGSSTRITYRGKISPDLSCPSLSPAVRALAADAAAVTGAAGIRPAFRRPANLR